MNFNYEDIKIGLNGVDIDEKYLKKVLEDDYFDKFPEDGLDYGDAERLIGKAIVLSYFEAGLIKITKEEEDMILRKIIEEEKNELLRLGDTDIPSYSYLFDDSVSRRPEAKRIKEIRERMLRRYYEVNEIVA
jgi:hypothetical protein